MKKLTLTSLILFLFTVTHAQNWAPFHLDDVAHYGFLDSITNTIVVKSDTNNGVTTSYRFNSIVARCYDCNKAGDYYINQPQFLGYSMEYANEIYTFQGKDTFIIDASIKQGGSWTFNFNTGITAEVIDQLEEAYLGVTDSIKVIALSNADTIKLGKQLGIIRFDYKQDVPLILMGEETKAIGEHVPTFKDFFNYKPGDVLVYRARYSLLDPGNQAHSLQAGIIKRYQIQEVLHLDDDSAVYSVIHDSYGDTGKVLPYATTLAFRAYEDKHLTNYNVNELVLNFPTHIKETVYDTGGYYDYTSGYSDEIAPAINIKSYLRLLKSTSDGKYFKLITTATGNIWSNTEINDINTIFGETTLDPNKTLPEVLIREEDFNYIPKFYATSIIYKEGLGLLTLTVYPGNNRGRLTLIGAKIDGKEYGELQPPGFYKLSIGEVETNSYNIYPNPASNKVTISIDNYVGKDAEVKIYNTSGQVVIAEEHDFTVGGLTLDIANLPLGVYYVKVLSGGGAVTKKLIVN